MKNPIIAFALSSLIIANCKGKSGTDPGPEKLPGDTVQQARRKTAPLSSTNSNADSLQSRHRKDSLLLKLTHSILTALKNKSYSAVAGYIDPVAGIRFSP